jgi:hypothetical protein
MGLAIGLALGVVVAGAFEMMDDRVHGEKELKKMLPPTILAEIPAIMNFSDEQRNKRRLWLGWATAAFVFATIFVGSAFSYLRG